MTTSEMAPSAQVDIVRAWLDHLASGDLEAARGLFAEDAVLHFPGRNPLAGDYTGPDQVLRLVTRAMDLIGASVDVHDVLSSDDHVVTLARMTVEHGGAAREIGRIGVYHVTDGKIREFWLHYGDQAVIDELTSMFSSA